MIDDFEARNLIEQCKHVFFTYVRNYWVNNSWVSLLNNSQSFNNIQIMLNAYFLDSCKEDRMIWRNNANGNFEVSSIFRSKETSSGPLWSKAWICGLTPKINIFF